MKDELYKKVYIHSVNDLPKEEDEYYVHKIGRGLDIFNWYGANFSSGWLEEIDWYLHPFPDQDLPSKEQNDRIREWFKHRTGLNTNFMNAHMMKIDEMLHGWYPKEFISWLIDNPSHQGMIDRAYEYFIKSNRK